MPGIRAAATALLLAGALVGCAAPAMVGPSADGPLTAAVRVRLVPPGPAPYALQAVVSGYTAADVDHVDLALYRAGAPVAGATATVARSGLGTPVALRNLRAGTAYEVRATAFADPAGATVLSDPQASRAAFTTPAVTTTAGLARIDEAPVEVPIAVALAARPVALSLAFKVVPAGNVRNRATHVRIRLLAGGQLVSERLETLAEAQAPHVLTNLKLGTGYALVAQALTLAPEAQLSDDARSALAFSTPASGTTSVETDLNVALGTPVASVPCARAGGQL